MKPMPPSSLTRRQAGVSLTEIMVAMAIGLALLAVLSSLFLGNARTQSEVEAANRKIENGRYAMHLLTEDLRHAGFYGELNPVALPPATTVPAPCLAGVASLREALRLHIQGYDGDSALPALGCLSDIRAGTDILVVRHASVTVTPDSALAAGMPYFQASLCNGPDELGSADPVDFYAIDTNAAGLDRTRRDCSTAAAKRRYLTHIYFVANNNEDGDGIPTLKRAELGSDGASPAFSIVPLVDGIENMQLEYGVYDDTMSAPKDYTADVGRYAADILGCVDQACVAQAWEKVTAVRLHLLARNIAPSAGYSDDKTYRLGQKYDGTDRTVGNFSASDAAFKRHVFQTTIVLTNPAGRYAP